MPQADRRFVRNSLIMLGAGGLLLVGVLLTALQAAQSNRDRADELALAQETRSAGRLLTGHMQDMETGQRGYLLTGQASYLEPFVASRDQIPADLVRLKAALAMERQPSELAAMSRTIADKRAELTRTVELEKAGRHDEAIAVVRSNQGKAAMDAFRREMAEIVFQADQRVIRGLSQLRASGDRLRWVTLGGGVLAAIFVVGSMILTRRYTRDLLTARTDLAGLNASLERRVRQRTADLTRANEEIQRFAYIVSHDLRAPLVNIMGFTSELDEGLTDLKRALKPGDARAEPDLKAAGRIVEDDMPEAIAFVRTSTRKMDGLINAILKLSREGGRLLSPEPVDLGGLFAQAIGSLRHTAEAKGARVAIEGELPTIVTDRLAAEQIFGNLLDNALKYLSPERPGDIRVRALQQAGQVTIEVEDNGRGIAQADLERVFELFRRAGAQDQPGEGIGLAHVRALVRRLGGEITVDSSTDRGSTFRVTLPRTLAVEAKGEA